MSRFSEFSQTQGDKLEKKLAHFLQVAIHWPSAAQDTNCYSLRISIITKENWSIIVGFPLI